MEVDDSRYVANLRAKVLCSHLNKLSLNSDACLEILKMTTLSLGLDSSKEEALRHRPEEKLLSDQSLSLLGQSLSGDLKELSTYLSGNPNSDFCHDINKAVEERNQNFAAINSSLESIAHSYKEVIDLTKEFDELAPAALSKVLPVLNAKRGATHDVLAITIEASLLKLSVIRNRLQASIYNHTPSGSKSNSTIGESVEKLMAQYSRREERLLDQEKSWRNQLDEYEAVLNLLDDKHGGFAQVVEDLTRIKKETEACKKDLRRLGWTDD